MTTVSTVIVSSPPWADFAFSALPAGTVACRILRADPDGTWRQLPGAGQRPVLGSEWRFIDHGLPVRNAATSIAYRLEPLSAAGAILPAGVLEWTVAAPTVTGATGWLSDPLDPLRAVPVTMLAPGREWGDSWTGAGGLFTPLGGDPVSSGFRRQRSRGWAVQTATDGQDEAVWEMVDMGGVLLLRADPGVVAHRTGVIYLHVEGASGPTLARVWSIPGTECAPPAILQLVAGRTYADDLAEHATYAISKAALPTYLDRMRA